ncbi:hypothetical protein JOC86_002393 [Bacillus pakistanensis]|uniref:Bacteriophage Gp15 protein n=1 Tax=Rossellomorea pakistanensis TaxID=992288 RepID=A0ABS2NE51_9BACI|nr:Gp15 family bacteriophage protein [Bacillus pakistanensis]MBM7585851.1 hypothetical protein [Bacillus pakistanensis]
MFTLTSSFDDDCFEYEDNIIHVDMAFDNILRLFEMFDDESLLEFEKIFIALEMLLYEYDLVKKKSYEEQLELFKFVMKEFLEIDLDSDKKEEGAPPKKFMDYKQDADLIFASFFAVYKLDLFELQGKLHWKKFEALMTHLDDNSPFKQVIGYRTMTVPSEKEASKEYIAHVRKMKRVHALKLDEEQQNNDDALSSAFSAYKKGGK